jgi:hypothetical protein
LLLQLDALEHALLVVAAHCAPRPCAVVSPEVSLRSSTAGH